MLNLDLPVEIQFRGQSLFQGKVRRAKTVIEKTIAERGDYTGIFSVEVMVDISLTDWHWALLNQHSPASRRLYLPAGFWRDPPILWSRIQSLAWITSLGHLLPCSGQCRTMIETLRVEGTQLGKALWIPPDQLAVERILHQFDYPSVNSRTEHKPFLFRPHCW